MVADPVRFRPPPEIDVDRTPPAPRSRWTGIPGLRGEIKRVRAGLRRGELSIEPALERLAHQVGVHDRLGEVVVAAAGERLLLLTGHRPPSEGDDAHVAAAVHIADALGGLPAVHDRHPVVHEDQVRRVGAHGVDCLLAVGRLADVESAELAQATDEDHAAVFIVLDYLIPGPRTAWT